MTKQEEIKLLLKTNKIKMHLLADKLDLNSRQLSYFLSDLDELPDDLYHKLKESIESFQVEPNLFDSDYDNSPDLFDAEELNASIGERIKIFAKTRFVTLTKLAVAMHITPQQLHQYTSGNREPGSKILIKLLNLGCDLNWLLGGLEKPESYKLALLENELKLMRKKLSDINKIVNKSNQD